MTVNYQLFEMLNHDAGRFDGLDDVMEFAATWLIYLAFAVTAALVALALYRRRLRPVFELGVTLALAFVAATAVAHVSTELRPFQTHHVHQLIAHEPGVSLPSDHATAAFALAFGVGLFLHRGWGAVLAVAALAVGFARIWVGVHYPSDIAAAAMIAGLAALEVALWGRWRARRASSAGGPPAVRGAA
jgi:undecaprenyl-diphosphatase